MLYFSTESSQILNLSINSEGDGIIFMSWMAPNMPNGVIINYSVRILDLKSNNVDTNLINGFQTNFSRRGLGMYD